MCLFKLAKVADRDITVSAIVLGQVPLYRRTCAWLAALRRMCRPSRSAVLGQSRLRLGNNTLNLAHTTNRASRITDCPSRLTAIFLGKDGKDAEATPFTSASCFRNSSKSGSRAAKQETHHRICIFTATRALCPSEHGPTTRPKSETLLDHYTTYLSVYIETCAHASIHVCYTM